GGARGGANEQAEDLLAPPIGLGELLEGASRVPVEPGQLLGETTGPTEEEGDRLAGVEVVREGRLEAFDQLLGRIPERFGELRARPFGPVPLQELGDPVVDDREARVGLAGLLEALARLEDERAAVLRVQVVEAKGAGADPLDRL